MRLEAILHIPMSEYCHGLDENHVVYRLRCAKDDLKSATLFYGDTACRVTPIIFTPVPMKKVASDLRHDYWEVIVDSLYNRVYYYFLLDDGETTKLYYGDVFTDHLVDDRSQYFKLPFNHRADIAMVPDWVKDAVVYNIFPDSFATSHKWISKEPTQMEYQGQMVHGKLGGTLRGVAENVDYLKGLGINCVYLNPIFAAGEYHKYDLLDYFHVDPCFGGDEAFRYMVDTLHAHGIRVIIDGVFNHCGWYFFAFDDVVKNQEKSRYCDWFYHLEFPVVRPENPEIYPNYACFAYERMMPKLDTANPEVRDYFCRVGEYWIKEYGLDGWRLDVASEVDDSFWRAFRKAVKRANPEALLIGEVWESANHWLQGDMFDSAMNYDFRKHCNLFFAEGSIDAADFAGRITNMLMRYRVQTVPAQLNLLDSHDVGRFLSLCEGDVEKYKLAILFMMSFVGMPTIFYGDELGIQGLLEEEYRYPMPWNGGDISLYEFFREAIKLRQDHIALRRGEFQMVLAEKESGLIVYKRIAEEETLTIAINGGQTVRKLPEMAGKLLWAKGLRQDSLDSKGFCVYQD
ncbi:MAG: glycoside hydrolase family 13 protein [Lachnospiraceae bacterium]|nr:glycoside hydrolase family 13 protein [Lachnospiraceae bacterium]